MSRSLVAALLLLAAGGLGAASAQTPPHPFLHNANPADPLFECGQKTVGQVACQAGNQCRCRYEAFGNAMLGTPPGYSWDCNPALGSCLVDIPATTSGNWGDGGSQSGPPPTVVVPYGNRGR
ncbi:MAG: hypothetical protein GC191_02740 [Azospirillum sp.]|nr:hypothetical protein [Azospirillum sp.]